MFQLGRKRLPVKSFTTLYIFSEMFQKICHNSNLEGLNYRYWGHNVAVISLLKDEIDDCNILSLILLEIYSGVLFGPI